MPLRDVHDYKGHKMGTREDGKVVVVAYDRDFPTMEAAHKWLDNHVKGEATKSAAPFSVLDLIKGTDPARSAFNADMAKGGGPYIGKRGGKWADPQHKIPWTEKYAHLDHKQMGDPDNPKSLAHEIRSKHATKNGHAIPDLREAYATGGGKRAFADQTKHFDAGDHRDAANKILAHRFDAADEKTHSHDEQAHAHLTAMHKLRGKSDKEAKQSAHDALHGHHTSRASRGRNKKIRSTHYALADHHGSRAFKSIVSDDVDLVKAGKRRHLGKSESPKSISGSYSPRIASLYGLGD